MSKDVNKTTPLLDKSESNVNSLQAQGGGEGELATKIYAASADLEWPDFVAYVNKVFDVEHGRLLAEPRGEYLMSQSDDELRQKLVTVLCLKPLGSLEPGHYLFPEVTISDADLDKLMHLFAAEHARLPSELREKAFNIVSPETESEAMEVVPLAAIDAELDRLKVPSA